jgi:hypothetical protein
VTTVYRPRSGKNPATLAATSIDRRRLAGASPGRHLYAIGGEDPDRSRAHRSVEAYDPNLDAWFETSALGKEAFGAAAAAVAPGGRYVAEDPAGGCASDGVIWLAGGMRRETSDQNTLYDDLLMHDPRAGGWAALPPLPAPTAFASAALLGDRLFVAGGAGPRFDASTIVRVFDTRAGRWAADAAPMAAARREHSLVALRGRLHAIGGVAAATTEVYDPVADAWTPGGALPEAMSGTGAALLSAPPFENVV